ncbi:hypothetical protein [Marinobacter sp. S6332]|uniref:hypothetical protein n=1 Tax=Marinobacter sp. S6332 TaxID=2926403 RepID=UPI001FF591BD|nr:hypothetical protein [Marinobacter sp. S6332]MCK0163796.1 hypothetical protein [Marinobacter sp. S6332]
MSLSQMSIAVTGLIMIRAVVSGEYWMIPFALIGVEILTGFAGSIMSYFVN